MSTNSTQNVFGFPPGTNLAGKSYTLVYTIDDTIGCKYYSGGAGGNSYITLSTPTSCPNGTPGYTTGTPGNPITSAVLTIGGGAVSFGNHPYSVVTTSEAERSVNVAVGVVPQHGSATFELVENYMVGNYTGGGSVSAIIYFINPPYSPSYNWEAPLTYNPVPPAGTSSFDSSGTFNYDLALYDPTTKKLVSLQAATGTLGISSLTVSGPITPPPAPPVAAPQAATTPAGVPVPIYLTNGASGCTATSAAIVVPVAPPSSGTLSLSGTTATFTPAAGFSGTVTFQFTLTNLTNACGTSAPAMATITVLPAPPPVPPTIACAASSNVCKTKTLWWFNVAPSQQPINYRTTLQATSRGTQYTWTITAGMQYAQFSNGLSTITANTNIVTVFPNADPGSGATVDVTVTVTTATGTATSAPFTLTLNKPWRLFYTTRLPAVCIPCLPIGDQPPPQSLLNVNYHIGYLSVVSYEIHDSSDQVLPYDVPTNEQFGATPCPSTATPVFTPCPDYPKTNWPRGQQHGNPGSHPGAFEDPIWIVAGLYNYRTFVPRPQFPQVPLGNVRVDHWMGSLRVGSDTAGAGVLVETLTWQRFQDHARHCGIESPPGVPGNVPNPPGC